MRWVLQGLFGLCVLMIGPVRAGDALAGASTAVDATAAVATAVEAAVPPQAEEVIVGAYINDIHELDFRTHSYAADLYVWFRWRDKDRDPSKSLEFMNRFAPDDHVRDQIYEEPKELPDGTFYSILRNQGQFVTKLRLENYPFDRQELRIELEDNESGTASQIYVADTNPLTLSPRILLPGFKIGQPRLEIRANQYPTNFGDPTVGDHEAYSRAALVIPIERPLTALSVKTFLPILLIIACAALVLFIRPAYIDARVGLGITALLTLVALQLAGGASLPDVDYLTMVDKVYLASYGFIMLVLLRVVRASWRDEAGGERGIARADRAWLLLILIAYAAVLGAIGVQSLSVRVFLA